MSWRILSDLGTDGTMTGLCVRGEGVRRPGRRRARGPGHEAEGRGDAPPRLGPRAGRSAGRAAAGAGPAAVGSARLGGAAAELSRRSVSSPLSEAQPPEVPARDRNGDASEYGGGDPASNIADRADCDQVASRMRGRWSLWVAGTLAVLAWGVTGWAPPGGWDGKADLVTDPIWVAAAREAVERLGTRRRRDTSTWRAGGHAADLGCRAADSAAARTRPTNGRSSADALYCCTNWRTSGVATA